MRTAAVRATRATAGRQPSVESLIFPHTRRINKMSINYLRIDVSRPVLLPPCLLSFHSNL